MKEIWFIRHGESKSNAGEIVSDVSDLSATPLTEKGYEQAKKLSLAFNKKPDLFVVTPYIRTRQTAKYCMERFPFVRCEEWDLQEFTYITPSLCVNTNREQRKPLTDVYWNKADSDYVHGEGAESFSMMVNRIKVAYKELQDREENFIAVFTHGLIMRTMLLMEYYPQASNKELLDVFIATKGRFEFDNCEIMRANADATGVHIVKPANYKKLNHTKKQIEYI